MPEGCRHPAFDGRCRIFALGKGGLSNGAIARRPGRGPSTVSRGLRRSGGGRGYWRRRAQGKATGERRAAVVAKPGRAGARNGSRAVAPVSSEGDGFRRVTDARVKRVRDIQDARPGKVLGYPTPAEAFARARPPWGRPTRRTAGRNRVSGAGPCGRRRGRLRAGPKGQPPHSVWDPGPWPENPSTPARRLRPGFVPLRRRAGVALQAGAGES